MATLNIKNFPDDLYERLQERAQREHRSLAQQVIHTLGSATRETSLSWAIWTATGETTRASTLPQPVCSVTPGTTAGWT